MTASFPPFLCLACLCLALTGPLQAFRLPPELAARSYLSEALERQPRNEIERIRKVTLHDSGEVDVVEVDYFCRIEPEGRKTLLRIHETETMPSLFLLAIQGADGDPGRVYLADPATGTTEVIEGEGLRASFLDSGWTYEDMLYIYRPYFDPNPREQRGRVKIAKVDGLPCLVVPSRAIVGPEKRYTGYRERRFFIDKEEQRIRQIEYDDLAGRLVKTVRFSHFETSEFNGRPYDLPRRMELTHHHDGYTTMLFFLESHYDRDVPERFFAEETYRNWVRDFEEELTGLARN